MHTLNHEERQTLRLVQTHLQKMIEREGGVVEQLSTVDVYFHPTNPDPLLNCVTPHKGVAWTRRADLSAAFAGLERLGRVPRLIFQDALFPAAFQQQLEMMGLELEEERVIMLYRPVYGPGLPDEVPLGRLHEHHDPLIGASLATRREDLATWLRIFRAGYFNSETLTVEPEALRPLVDAQARGDALHVLATYHSTPLGAARVSLRPPTAALDAVVTAPLWHGMGLEEALISVAVRGCLVRGCPVIYTIGRPADYLRLYRRLGFIDLTHVLTMWLPEEYEDLVPLPNEPNEPNAGTSPA